MAPVTAKKYVLTLGENTFAGPASTNITDARKLQSLIPSLSGALEREHQLIPFTADVAFPARIGFFWQYKRNALGVVTTYWFLAAFPVARNINNLLHLSDGTSSWIFDGTNWVKEGLAIPSRAPTFSISAVHAAVNLTTVSRVNGATTITFPTFNTGNPITAGYITIAGNASDTTFNGTFLTTAGSYASCTLTFNQPGLADSAVVPNGTIQPLGFTVLANRYYWTTFSDQSLTHPHESSSSPRTSGTGVIAAASYVFLNQRAGSVSTGAASTQVVGVGTDFNANDVGMVIRFSLSASVTPTILSVQDSQHVTLSAVAGVTVSAASGYTIAPARATHWNLYGSATEEDRVGQFLASVPVGGVGLQNTYPDQSPMIGTANSYVGATVRPLLNDPPNATLIMEQHKYRLWRRLETFQNYFTYSGNEEILAEQTGAPQECVPGIDARTVSPAQVNSTSYPDQSVQLRGMQSHGDALYVGTESNVIPLYGSSLTDFALSQAQAFAVGFAGKRATCSTPFGLAFLSYDLKVYLYPSQYSFGVDSTTALVELGRPKRPEFELIKGSDLDNVNLIFYNWGRRNWLVMSYQRTDGTFGAWVFDFEVKGWFQLQQGYTALGVFEMRSGLKTLVGAGTDNKVYVIDDLTGNFTPNPATNYPVGTYRELLDFGDPDSTYVIKSIGYEKSNAAMGVNVTIWLDPIDPENPGVGIPITMAATRLGANSYLGRPTSATGATCQRVLVEFSVTASTAGGRFHGFTVEAEKITLPVL